MRGRRPQGTAGVDHLPGSSQAKERLKVVLENVLRQHKHLPLRDHYGGHQIPIRVGLSGTPVPTPGPRQPSTASATPQQMP